VTLRAYECYPTYLAEEGRRYRCTHGGSVIHAQSASKARYLYFLQVGECYPDLKLHHIGVKSLGVPKTLDDFLLTAKYRGVPFARIGMDVEVDGRRGVIVGNNSSANFDVLFDDGQRGNCHPNYRVKYFDAEGKVLAEFGG
jgi:hypothetical protein